MRIKILLLGNLFVISCFAVESNIDLAKVCQSDFEAINAKVSASLNTQVTRCCLNNDSKLIEPFPEVREQIYQDCVVNAMAGAIEYISKSIPMSKELTALNICPLKISRSALYYNARYLAYGKIESWKQKDDSWNSDLGVTYGDVFLAIKKYGVCPENSIIVQSYDPTRFYKIPGWEYELMNTVPAPEMYAISLKEGKIDSINEEDRDTFIREKMLSPKDFCSIENAYPYVSKNIRCSIINAKKSYDENFYKEISNYFLQDRPLLIGIGVDKGFSKGQNTIGGTCLPFLIPDGKRNSDVHAIMVLGYGNYTKEFLKYCSDTKANLEQYADEIIENFKECFYVQNSWGTKWGYNGRAWMSKSYFEKFFYGGCAIWLE